MIILVRLVGVLITVFGAIYLLKPETMRKMVSFWAKGKRVYTAGLLDIIVSIVFLLTALKCKMPLVIALAGILCLIKGIVIFLLGPQGFVSRIDKLVEKPVAFLRFMSFLALLLGVLIVCSA